MRSNSVLVSPVTEDDCQFHPGQTLMKKINVVLAIRDIDLRLSLDLMLRDGLNLNVLGTATTFESTLGLIRAERPDIVLLEWSLCSCPIEDGLKHFKEGNPELKVIMLGNRTSQEQLAHHFGADALIRIGGAPEDLHSTIRNLISQETENSKFKE